MDVLTKICSQRLNNVVKVKKGNVEWALDLVALYQEEMPGLRDKVLEFQVSQWMEMTSSGAMVGSQDETQLAGVPILNYLYM